VVSEGSSSKNSLEEPWSTEASRTAPGSLETVSARRPASPPVEAPSQRPCAADSSPANSRRERYGIATIMARAAVAPPPPATAVVPGPPTEAEAAPARGAPAADNSFDSGTTSTNDTLHLLLFRCRTTLNKMKTFSVEISLVISRSLDSLTSTGRVVGLFVHYSISRPLY